MTPEKMYNPADPLAITLTMEQWSLVLCSLDNSRCYFSARMYQSLAALHDKELAQKEAAEYKAYAERVAALHKIIDEECVKYYAPPGNQTE